MRVVDLKNQVFGRLTVLGRSGSLHGHAAWLCKCTCGNTCTATSVHLRFGTVTSCGCRRKEGLHRTHEKSHWPEYRSWSGAKFRSASWKIVPRGQPI